MIVWVVFFAIFLFVVGSIFGSFVGAMIWRLHELQRYDGKSSNTSSDELAVEARKMWRGFWGFNRDVDGKKLADKYRRSYCEHCGHELRSVDLIPLWSWLSTVGKCRYCGAKIGASTVAIELSGGVLFVVSYLLWPISHPIVGPNFANFLQPLNLAQFIVWLMAVVLLLALFFYDARWCRLPNFFMYPLMFVALIFAILSVDFAHFSPQILLNFALALLPVFGVYLSLFAVSSGEWIGFGDVKFGIVVALLAADWRLSLVVLVFANFAGTLFIIPGLAMRKLSRHSQIAFGPFLIGATFLIVLLSPAILRFWTNFLLT